MANPKKHDGSLSTRKEVGSVGMTEEEEEEPVEMVESLSPGAGRLDAAEQQLGIASYLSPSVPGFLAVSKARYADFVVHEVGLDGRRAQLTCMDPNLLLNSTTTSEVTSVPAVQNTGQKRKRSDQPDDEHPSEVVAEGEASAAPSVVAAQRSEEETGHSSVDWDQIQVELSGWVGPEAAQETVVFLQQTPSHPNATRFIALPSLADKNQRRDLHQWIRSRLHFYARSDTMDGAAAAESTTAGPQKIIRIWHKQFEKQMPNYNKFERQPAGDSGRRERSQRLPPGLNFLEFVLYKENMDTGSAMAQIQRRLEGPASHRGRARRTPSWRLGYAGNKDKRGITSQFVTLPARAATQALPSLCSWNRTGVGGGHTTSAGMGLMRVGNFRYVPDELSLGSLRGNRFDIVLRNVQHLGQTPPIHNDGLFWEEELLRQAAESLKETGFINYFGMQRFGKYYDTHLTGACVIKGDYEGAIDLIMKPKEGERENITLARKEWQHRFQNGSDQATAERDCTRKVLKELGRYMTTESAILNALLRNPLDYKKAFGCIPKTMRMMFMHAVQSYVWNHAASERIESLGRKVAKGDLVLSKKSCNEGGVEVKVVTEDDLNAGVYVLEDVVLPLLGTKSQLPENESAHSFDAHLEELGLSCQLLQNIKDRDLHMDGDYRKLICRPSDLEYRIAKYTDERQPLLQTDLMRLNGVDVEPDATAGENILLGMIVGFTLPSSSYATICLRELMKVPTSSDYQKVLRLGKGE